jgi:hypothetical protein
MSNFRRKKPKDRKIPSWSHKPELDPEPDPSKSGPVKKRKKKDWVVTGMTRSYLRKKEGKKRCVYSRHVTEKQATQAMEAMVRNYACWEKMFPNSTFWSGYDFKVEYKGN